jgi:putative inorganic carbon (hco3(-)) transporter
VNLSDNGIKRNVILFSILYIFINAVFISNEFYWLNLLPLAIFLGYLLFFYFEAYIFILIASLPVSIPLRTITEGLAFDISLPGEVLIIIGLSYFILKTIFNNNFDKKILFHPVTIAIAINIFWILITSVTSTLPAVSFKFLASRIWFVGIFYFVLLLIFIGYKRFFIYIWCYSLPFIIVMIYFSLRLINEGAGKIVAVANYVTKPFFPDHTSYAAAMAMLIPVLGFIIAIKRKASAIQKIFFISIFVIYILALVFSYTRAAWLSLIVASGLILLISFKIRLKTALLIFVSFILLLYYGWTTIEILLSRNRQDSSSDIFKHVKSVSNISTDASNLERINRWNSALKMYHDKPVFGFGPGTYMFKYAGYQSTNDKTIISTNAGNLGNAHSEYLGPLAEMGLIGMLTHLGIVLTTMFTASRVYFTARKRKVKYMALALMFGLLSYNIHGLMNNFLDLDKLNVLFWGFTAMIVALDVYHNKVHEKKKWLFSY